MDRYVIRKKYKGDILFKVINIISDIAVLKGVYIRLYATAPLSDLIDVNLEETKFYSKTFLATPDLLDDMRGFNHLTGKILHIDSDSSYLKKCHDIYQKLGLSCVCVKIDAAEMSKYILNLVREYNVDIVVITGHDSFNGKDKYNINNYQNSKFFLNAIIELRKYYSVDNLFIFAGACQSFFEAFISAGANMASSKKRVNIDAYDPLICAVKAATTPFNKIISYDSIWNHSYSKESGISGIESYGKMRILR